MTIWTQTAWKETVEAFLKSDPDMIVEIKITGKQGKGKSTLGSKFHELLKKEDFSILYNDKDDGPVILATCKDRKLPAFPEK